MPPGRVCCSSSAGLHALHSVEDPADLDVKAYATRVGRAKEQQTVYREVWAAEVADAVNNVVNADLSEHYMKLVEIHAAPGCCLKQLRQNGKPIER